MMEKLRNRGTKTQLKRLPISVYRSSETYLDDIEIDKLINNHKWCVRPLWVSGMRGKKVFICKHCDVAIDYCFENLFVIRDTDTMLSCRLNDEEEKIKDIIE